MALLIDLDPSQQRELEMRARSEGVSLNEYALRRLLFPSPSDKKLGAPLVEIDTERGLWEARQRAAVMGYIHAPEEEVARRHAPDISHLQAKIDASLSATPEEIAAAVADWEAHQEAMNGNRRITDEKSLYAGMDRHTVEP